MNKIIIYFLVLSFGVSNFVGLNLSSIRKASAVNYNNLISDGEFTDWQTMDADGIQWFLNTHGASRIRSFSENGRTAAQIIYSAARANGINPYAILATIQKEESIIESNTNFDYRARWAMGYGVCDGCDSNDPALQRYSGFTNQIMNGTWQLKRNYSYWASVGDWKVGTTRNFDGTNVHFDNRATSSLFRYTPHLHGNENFNGLYNRYKNYRPPASYEARVLAKVPKADMTVRPGQRIYMLVVLRNTGTAVWTKTGNNAMHIGNWDSMDRNSAFTGNTNQRWEMLQGSARRNGAGTFRIWFDAPEQEGTYREVFKPVMEHVTWFGPDIVYNFTVSGSKVYTKGSSKTPATNNVPANTSMTAEEKRNSIGIGSTNTPANVPMTAEEKRNLINQ